MPWTGGSRLITLWDILKQHLKAYAAHVAIQFSVLSSFEKEFEDTRLWIVSHNPSADYKPGGRECGLVLEAAMRLAEIADECELKTSPPENSKFIPPITESM